MAADKPLSLSVIGLLALRVPYRRHLCSWQLCGRHGWPRAESVRGDRQGQRKLGW